MKNDFDGLNVSLRADSYESIGRATMNVSRWSGVLILNQERTNVGASFNFFQRDRVNSQDDPRWANSDFRDRVGDNEFNTTMFRNDSANSGYGQYDVRPSVSSNGLRNVITDTALANSKRIPSATAVVNTPSMMSGLWRCRWAGHLSL